MLILELLLYFSLILIIHSYLFYPVSIFLLSKKGTNFKKITEFQPGISILISAYNEEHIIENTIRRILESHYDKSKIEIIVGSDKSADNTDNILRKLSSEFNNIKFYPFVERRGKSAVINDLVEKASHNLLFFTDANTCIHPDAIRNIVAHYFDDNIGGVCGKLVLVDNSSNRTTGYEEKNYWDLESWLKNLEGNLGILIGANGGIYSIRKDFFEKIPTEHPVMDDFFISMKVLEKRKKMVFENRAVAEENVAPSLDAEFKRKIRNNAIALSTIKDLKNLLKPSYRLIAFAFWSHKIIRWFSPLLLLIILTTNLLLINTSNIFEILFFIQVCFYFISLAGLIFRTKFFYPKYLVMPFYFTMTNVAMLIGLIKFLMRKQTSFWMSTPRK